MDDPATVTDRSRTIDNTVNLSPAYLDEMQRRYAGTPIGRQELDGEIVEDRMNGLWQLHWLAQARLSARPELKRIVVAAEAGDDNAAAVGSGGRGDRRIDEL